MNRKVHTNVIPVILAGGSGARLWPLSRSAYPKQFLPLLNEKSMLQETVLRAQRIHQAQPPIILCHQDYRFIVAEQLVSIGVKNATLILEPISKNTAPAVTIAALYSIQQQDSILCILPADHVINDVEQFAERMNTAIGLAEDNHLITFGVKPTRPETGYGYIKTVLSVGGNDQGYPVCEFIEKPGLNKAKHYLELPNYWWNSGIFIFKATSYLAEIKQHSPDILTCCQNTIDSMIRDLDFIRLDETLFSKIPCDSIDYAIMEKTRHAIVLPLNTDWSDVGSWSALYEMQQQDNDGNVLRGDVITQNVKNSYLHAENRLLAAVGVSDVIIIETSDAVLVTNKNTSQAIKNIVFDLIDQKRPETQWHKKVYRPWGYYELLYRNQSIQVKYITVKPKSSLSLQLHHHRSEHWVIVKGVAQVTRGNDLFNIEENQSTYIPKHTKHRLFNPTDQSLEMIEVQLGSYLGEDDIIRFEDNYGRITDF